MKRFILRTLFFFLTDWEEVLRSWLIFYAGICTYYTFWGSLSSKKVFVYTLKISVWELKFELFTLYQGPGDLFLFVIFLLEVPPILDGLFSFWDFPLKCPFVYPLHSIDQRLLRLFSDLFYFFKFFFYIALSFGLPGHFRGFYLRDFCF